jgi:hypothetical protein
MVGKLTWYRATSGIICALMDHPKYFDKIQCLKRAIDEKNGIVKEQTPQTNRQRTGDLLEPILIQEVANRLGLTNVRANIDYKIEHSMLPLEASLDGLAEAKDIVVKENVDKGIYLPTATKLKLNGTIPIEVKVSSEFPHTAPPEWLGVLQLFSSMEILDAEYGVLIVLYGADLRTFVYQRQADFAQKLKEVVLDFDRRVDEEDWYIPENTEQAYTIFDKATDEEQTLLLDEDTVEDIDQYLTLKGVAKQAEETADLLMTSIMCAMGNHSKGRSEDYKIDWGVRNYKATEERVIPAKEARSIRLKTPKITRINK